MPDCIRVVLVDDHAMVRVGLRTFLEFAADIEIVGEAATEREACEQVARCHPDVVLMDLLLGEGDGVAAIAHIRAACPAVRIIALTSFAEPPRMRATMAAGAHGFLDKTVAPDALLSAIRQVADGHIVLEPATLSALQAHADTDAVKLATPFTAREFEVLTALCQGLSNKEIAHALGIAEKTVKVHVSHVLSKLDVYDRSQAIIAAVKRGLITL